VTRSPDFDHPANGAVNTRHDGVDRLTIEHRSDSRPVLSIIIPAHNEEHRLPPTLDKIDAFLRTLTLSAEVIVVENGSHDRTAEVTREYSLSHPYVRLLEVDTRGKGLAVKAGMLAALGDYRFICDADLSMPIEEIIHFLPPYSDGFDISIATREGKDSRRIGEPFYRHLIGRINNLIIKLTAIRDFEDTQCGFKMFSREVAEDLFSVQQMNGIGFDIELLFLAKRRGYSVREVPITWYYNDDSRMRLVQDSLHLLMEIWYIHRNWRQGLYARQSDPDRQSEP
jgi:glycosyltransferase involved in cell wall biosynthesis